MNRSSSFLSFALPIALVTTLGGCEPIATLARDVDDGATEAGGHAATPSDSAFGGSAGLLQGTGGRLGTGGAGGTLGTSGGLGTGGIQGTGGSTGPGEPVEAGTDGAADPVDAGADPTSDLCNMAAAQRVLSDLGLVANGAASAHTIDIPGTLSGPNWALKQMVCADGCYDLTPFAGSTACLVRQPVTSTCANEPALAWVVMRRDRVACVYQSVREDSTVAPGVCAASIACAK